MSIQFYEDNAEDFFRRSVDVDMASGWRGFTALVKPGGRVLEAGCGSGRDALFFHKAGFQVTATEASTNLAVLARQHTGLPVEVMTFDQMAWRQAFDGIWTCASLLHVPRADLPGVMGRLRDALIPGGVWWMSFKYGADERVVAGRHFTDLDEAGARALIEGVGGLQLISMDIGGDSRPERAHERWLSLLCRRV